MKLIKNKINIKNTSILCIMYKEQSRVMVTLSATRQIGELGGSDQSQVQKVNHPLSQSVLSSLFFSFSNFVKTHFKINILSTPSTNTYINNFYQDLNCCMILS